MAPTVHTFHLEVASGYVSSLIEFKWEHIIGWRLHHFPSPQARGMCNQEQWWAVHHWAVDVSNKICFAANNMFGDFDQTYVKRQSSIIVAVEC